MNKDQKQTTIKDFGTHAKDTGSAPVQVAIITKRINHLTEHLRTHTKDKHSRRGLIGLVGKRRKLLRYMQNTNPEAYTKIIAELGLRK